MNNKINRMKELNEILGKAADAYYNTGVEIMSDREYDKLYDELSQLEQETGIILSGSRTQKVGYEVSSALKPKCTPFVIVRTASKVLERAHKVYCTPCNIYLTSCNIYLMPCNIYLMSCNCLMYTFIYITTTLIFKIWWITSYNICNACSKHLVCFFQI